MWLKRAVSFLLLLSYFNIIFSIPGYSRAKVNTVLHYHHTTAATSIEDPNQTLIEFVLEDVFDLDDESNEGRNPFYHYSPFSKLGQHKVICTAPGFVPEPNASITVLINQWADYSVPKNEYILRPEYYIHLFRLTPF